MADLLNTSDALQVVLAEKKEHIVDVGKLIEIYAGVRNYDVALGDYRKEIKELPSYYGPPGGCLLLAYCKEEPSGCVAYRRFSEDSCEMKRLFVLERFRGHGIGQKLVSQLLDQAKVNGYKRMLLDTHPWMHEAIRLYQSFGFVEIDAYHYNPTPGIRFFELKL